MLIFVHNVYNYNDKTLFSYSHYFLIYYFCIKYERFKSIYFLEMNKLTETRYNIYISILYYLKSRTSNSIYVLSKYTVYNLRINKLRNRQIHKIKILKLCYKTSFILINLDNCVRCLH